MQEIARDKSTLPGKTERGAVWAWLRPGSADEAFSLCLALDVGATGFSAALVDRQGDARYFAEKRDT